VREAIDRFLLAYKRPGGTVRVAKKSRA